MKLSSELVEALRRSDEAVRQWQMAMTKALCHRVDEQFTSGPALKWRAVLSMKGAQE